MKIDIHVHTKKTKQGDKSTREVDAQKFHEIISSTDIKIVAITNHNVFDFEQYIEFATAVGEDFQIWPGVELDVLEEDRKGHLLVIVSPKYAQSLGDAVANITRGVSPDKFNISIDDVISTFDNLGPLYVAHYKSKKPDLIDEDIGKLVDKTANKNRVLKEATNAISAGIFISHGHASIYGSDVQDWDNYHAQSDKLPELRLPVESFEQFCLLLNKDVVAINTLLDKKEPETIFIKPFKEDPPFGLTVYEDINVFFGAKGTGKSDILTAIAEYYVKKGISACKYESGSEKLSNVYDLNGVKLNIDLNDYGVEYCNKEIDLIRKSQEVDVTSVSKYRQFFSDALKSKKASRIKIRDYQKEQVKPMERGFNEVKGVYGKFVEFRKYLGSDASVKKLVEHEKLSNLISGIDDILVDLNEKRLSIYTDYKTAELFNNLVDKIKAEITKKTGAPDRPSDTGFRDYALNRIEIEKAVKIILGNLEKKMVFQDEYVGNLDEKGDLYCRTEVLIQNGNITDGEFKPIRRVGKKTQKEFSRVLQQLGESIYTEMLFEYIANFNAMDGIDDVPTILELLIFRKYFVINGKEYKPSTGEQAMILLQNELNEDKDVYVLDEPEKSLGNEYINNVILPLVKEKAKAKKKVFIATHDANIAVRTLPYNSIYRYHGADGYETYVGNPFINYLTSMTDQEKKIDWKEISMRTLEGGISAFGERGQIYGKI